MSQMELKRSASPPSNETNPKRRATEDSPLSQLFNDAGIQALARILVDDPRFDKQVQKGKKILISLDEIVNNSTKKSANDIYNEACDVWEYKRKLMSACTYGIDEEPSLLDKLLFYTNDDPPAERMASMMKDPWLKYILGLAQSDAFVRGFLSILIAYWNVKELLYKHKVAQYGRTPAREYIPPVNEKIERVTYVIKHVEDFQNLKEVLESMYGSDPALAANLFEQISSFQVGGMHLNNVWTPEDRAIVGDRPLMIRVAVRSVESKPFSLFKVFSVKALPSDYII